MIAQFCGLAIDARVQRRDDLKALARTSRWIAGNALGLRGRRLFTCGALPEEPWLARVRIAGFGDLLAALAVAPSLLAAEDLPARWRLGLRVLGVPLLDELVSTTLAGGVSVLTLAPYAPWSVEGERQARSDVAPGARAQQQLAA